jgi:short-subunit dehydrogenase
MASRVWLITGTTSEFGAEFVKNLLARGDKVITTARDTSKIKHFSSQGAATLKLDLSTDQSALNQTIKEAVEIYGQIDVVVNNAGYSHFGIVEDERFGLSCYWDCDLR